MGIKLSKSDIAFIKQLPVCRLATATEECEPVVRPVWPVFDGANIYIASDPDTPKLEHIETNPQVSLVFDDYDKRIGPSLKASVFREKQRSCGMAKNTVMLMTCLKRSTPSMQVQKASQKRETYQ